MQDLPLVIHNFLLVPKKSEKDWGLKHYRETITTLSMTSPIEVVLLSKRIPHVLETIFVNFLDYPDLLSCLDTSKRMREVLNRELLAASCSRVRSAIDRKRIEFLWSNCSFRSLPVDMTNEAKSSYKHVREVFRPVPTDDYSSVVVLAESKALNRMRFVKMATDGPQTDIMPKKSRPNVKIT